MSSSNIRKRTYEVRNILNEKFELSNDVFKIYQKIVFSETGITLSNNRISLVQSRLYRRILQLKLTSYTEYLRVIQIDNKEKMEMLNLITTNETYFFREESHFNFLIKHLEHMRGKVRIWSAASSVGAEAYTIAMILNNFLSLNDWEVIGSDINSDVLKKARMGLYPLGWLDKIPTKYKTKYCLRGKGKYENQFLVDRKLTRNISFSLNNLMTVNKEFGMFQIIFLRNVLIYFNDETKKHVVNTVRNNLEKDGYLIISLTESLQNLGLENLVQVSTSIYQKKG